MGLLVQLRSQFPQFGRDIHRIGRGGFVRAQGGRQRRQLRPNSLTDGAQRLRRVQAPALLHHRRQQRLARTGILFQPQAIARPAAQPAVTASLRDRRFTIYRAGPAVSLASVMTSAPR